MDLDVEARFLSVLRTAALYDPDALFITGDCCAQEPVASVYTRMAPLTERLGVPVHIIPGNHDDRAMLRASFDLPGQDQEPICYERTIGQEVFLFLDTSTGKVGDNQLDWLEAALASRRNANVVMHHPPIPCGVEHMDAKYPLLATERLLHLLTHDGSRRRIFCGHYHASRTVMYRNLEVYLCPPTSFFIDPRGTNFHLQHRPPGFLLLEWPGNGQFRCADIVVEEGAYNSAGRLAG